MEKMRIAMGRSGRVWPAVLKTVMEGRRMGRRVILYVPEQMTLQTERDLIGDLRLKGLLDIEVISPRKLRLMVREKTGGTPRRTLDAAGQVMAVHRAMTEQAKELGFYRNMTDFPGAVERVRGALAELLESDLTPEEAEGWANRQEGGAAREKVLDLVRIRRAYEELASEQFEDEKKAWTETVNRLDRTDIFRDADLLVYGFDTVRPDTREMLCRAWSLARHVWVFLTADTEEAKDAPLFGEQHRSLRKLKEALEAAGGETETFRIETERQNCGEMLKWLDANAFAEKGEQYPCEVDGEISLCAAADRGEEAEQAAECLLQWHEMGIPWERMAVALPADSPLEGVLCSRLRLSGIPFCLTEKIPAVSHGVCRMLTAVLECVSGGYTTEQMTEAALSGFSGLSGEEALLLANYAEANGIEGSRWKQPFTRGGDAAEAEAARRKIIGPMESFKEKLKAAENTGDFLKALMGFLEEIGVPEKLKERESTLLEAGLYREAVADRLIWKQLTDMLDQLWTLMSERPSSVKDFRNMLESALSSAGISSLPETESGVMLGGVGHMLPGDTEALVLPGFQEGVMTAPGNGWLTDQEREELEAGTGKEVGISRERMGWVRKYDFYRTMTTPRRFLRISWSLRDEGGTPLQEEPMIGDLRGIFPGLRVLGGVRGAGESLVPRTPRKALESLGSLFAALREGRREEAAESAAVTLLHSGIYGRTVRNMLAEEQGGKEIPPLQADTAARLFRTEEVSISRLERFAACPYQHFIDYGLRPVQQEEYTFDSAEAGTFFHAALDRYMKTAGGEPGWPELPEERVDGIMDAICAELTEEWEGGPLQEDALGIWQGEEYLRRVRHAARVLTRFAANSDFRTIATEKSFGKPGGLPPTVLELADGTKVAVQGIIDRIDTYENGEGVWLRVVDNKSSEKKPDPAKMEDGEQLQLMIYLKAAERAYPGARAAGALFFPIRDTEISAVEETPESTAEERIRKVRMKGLVAAREDVVRAMDRDIRPYSLDEVFKQDGTVRKGADWAVEEDVLQGLMAAAEKRAAEIAAEIRGGRIEAAPRGSAPEDSPCRYCDYRSLCHAGKESLRPRNAEITYRDIARSASGKNTLREEEK